MQRIVKLSVALMMMGPVSCDSGPLVPLQEDPIVTDALVYEAQHARAPDSLRVSHPFEVRLGR